MCELYPLYSHGIRDVSKVNDASAFENIISQISRMKPV